MSHAEEPPHTRPIKRGTVRSMTGFARISGVTPSGISFILALKSVNHRFLDLQFHLPAGTDEFEMQCRRSLKEHLVRGHVEVRLTVQRKDTTALPEQNPAAIAAYVEAFRAAALQHNLSGEPDLNRALSMPTAWIDSAAGVDDPSALESAATACMPAAVAALNAMREQEGSSLAAELRATLSRLRAAVDELTPLRAGMQQAHMERLKQKIRELLSDGPEPDSERLLHEAAVLAERSDIEEELARMRAHIEHFEQALDEGGELGRKLDFLLQEMTREANTTLSKTGGIANRSLRITELGLTMKSEIEKAREQVQNLE